MIERLASRRKEVAAIERRSLRQSWELQNSEQTMKPLEQAAQRPLPAVQVWTEETRLLVPAWGFAWSICRAASWASWAELSGRQAQKLR